MSRLSTVYLEFMANTFIQLLDAKGAITAAGTLRALAGVPFVTHQFAWLVQKVVTSRDAATLASYAGVKNLTPDRAQRLSMCVSAISSLPASEIAGLPDRVLAGQDLGRFLPAIV